MNTCKILAVGAAIAAPLLSALPAKAVPAWGRRTGVDCASCHFGGTNRLTAMGRDFMVRGHRLKSEEGGKPGDKSLNYLDYASFASKVRFTMLKDRDPSSSFDVESLAIYAGGPMSANFSFFFEHYLHERGSQPISASSGTATTTYRSKLADAFLKYNSAPGADTYWWARAGQLYPLAIYTADSGGRLGIGRPLAINSNVGGGNAYTPRDRSLGASMGYVGPMGFRAEAGIVNGAGGNSRPEAPENNNYKDTFITVEKDLDEFGSGLGLYAYNGKYVTATSPTRVEDHFTRVGILGAFQRSDYILNGAYFIGKNNLADGGNRKPKSYYIQAAYNIDPGLTTYARYDRSDPDLSSTKPTKGPVVGVSYRLSDVGRIVAEYSDYKTGSTRARGLTMELNWLY